MLNLRQIEVFRAVMVAGTLHGAAGILNVAQPGLSRLIRHVEDRLGVALFDRRRGRLVPTPEAQSLFAEIEPIFHQIEQLKIATDRIGRGEGHTLKVAASPSLSRYIVPCALAGMTKDKGKGIRPVQFDVLSTDQVVDYLTWRYGEAVVTIFPVDHPMIMSRLVGNGRLVAIVPADHLLAQESSITANALAQYDIIGFETATPHGDIIASTFAQANTAYRPKTLIRFAESACALVEAGLGVAIVDEFTTSGDVYPHLAIRPLDIKATMGVYINTNNSVGTSVALRQFEDALVSVLSELGLVPEKGSQALPVRMADRKRRNVPRPG